MSAFSDYWNTLTEEEAYEYLDELDRWLEVNHGVSPREWWNERVRAA